MSNPFEGMAREDLQIVENALTRELNHIAGIHVWMNTQLPPCPARDQAIRDTRERELRVRTLLIRAIEAGSDPAPVGEGT